MLGKFRVYSVFPVSQKACFRVYSKQSDDAEAVTDNGKKERLRTSWENNFLFWQMSFVFWTYVEHQQLTRRGANDKSRQMCHHPDLGRWQLTKIGELYGQVRDRSIQRQFHFPWDKDLWNQIEHRQESSPTLNWWRYRTSFIWRHQLSANSARP